MNKKLGFQRFPKVKSELWVPCPKRVRVFFDGKIIADSRRVMLLRQFPIRYFFPREDVNMDWLEPSEQSHTRKLGKTRNWTVKVEDRKAEGAAWQYIDPPSNGHDVEGYVTFDWDSMDEWYEEDEPITVHPRDPYTRIDMLQSSRNVGIVIAGETIAESNRPVLLFETGHMTRYYLYRTDVRLDLLEPTDKHTGCPYKGTASYYSVRVGDTYKENVVWTYRSPYPECSRIQNMLCFYSEKIKEFYVDGELLSETS